jgi:hypothetical protein
MSIRIAASAAQLEQVRWLPRGARMMRGEVANEAGVAAVAGVMRAV